jgi:ABC-2 type transport system ATP-binding protein
MVEMSDEVIVAEGLRKRFKHTEALRGLDLSVPAGTVCGLLGPNGAGKTTAVRILATLTRPDSGRARVAGYDVVRDAASVRGLIGLAGQHAAVDEKLSGRDNLRMFGRLYHLPGRLARKRADELLDQFSLAGAADRVVKGYSGGMRRKLDLAASLIVAPPVLFMDEPTTGLDPRSRADIWAGISELARTGTTVLLTTQYMDEADQLAAQIAVVDAGRVIASGTPGQLKAAIGGALTVVVADAAALGTAASLLQRMTGADPVTEPGHRQVSVAVASDAVTLAGVAVQLSQAGVEAEDIALRRPTLDDVFLRLTGSSLDDAGSPGHGSSPGDDASPGDDGYTARAETAGTAA